MEAALGQLQKTVFAIQPLAAEDWGAFSTRWKQGRLGRKQTITVAGSRESHLYFITEGVQRIFYLDEEEREATLLFTYAPSFGGVIDSLLLGTPSRYYYETLTASSFLQLAQTDLQELMNTRPAIEAFVRKALSISMSGLLERLAELQCFSSEEKFKKLLHRSPHILQLVPHKYLANYLGINATNFSKLLNSVRI
ncbi:MAG TPA: cyclic nucleotide-binding domain-containing protein [Flavisolibacter sp.]|nr:cyclic nucleotide-binding domain-containing protein [Flavisolibacter sp.]